MSDAIKIKADKDGQVRVLFDVGDGRRAMLNLNNIVNEVNPDVMPLSVTQLVGFTKEICLLAMRRAVQETEQ